MFYGLKKGETWLSIPMILVTGEKERGTDWSCDMKLMRLILVFLRDQYTDNLDVRERAELEVTFRFLRTQGG